MKTIDITKIYQLLNSAKLTKMEDSDKIKVIKTLRVIKPISKGYEDFATEAQKKLMGENHAEMQKKAEKWNKEHQNQKYSDLSEEEVEELKSITGYFDAYNQRVAECLRDEAEKEQSLEYERLSGDAFSKLVASNDWTCGQILFISDFIEK